MKLWCMMDDKIKTLQINDIEIHPPDINGDIEIEMECIEVSETGFCSIEIPFDKLYEWMSEIKGSMEVGPEPFVDEMAENLAKAKKLMDDKKAPTKDRMIYHEGEIYEVRKKGK